jgi:hypothetical protein
MSVQTNAVLQCQRCGRAPAAKVAFQSIKGLILMHQITTVRGVFCRDCGLAVKQQMNGKTLKFGWFSLGGLVGIPIFLLSNQIRAGKLTKLGG